MSLTERTIKVEATGQDLSAAANDKVLSRKGFVPEGRCLLARAISRALTEEGLRAYVRAGRLVLLRDKLGNTIWRGYLPECAVPLADHFDAGRFDSISEHLPLSFELELSSRRDYLPEGR